MTIRSVLVAALAASFLASGSAHAQFDEVHFENRATGKEDSIRGEIVQDTPAGIRVRVRGADTAIPAAEIRLIMYQVREVSALDFRSPFGKEARALAPGVSMKQRQELLAQAQQGYEELLPRISSRAAARRYLQYKIATVKVALAEDDPTREEGAVVALKAFKNEYPDGWQIVPALRLLARLLSARGDLQGARRTYENLAKTAGIGPETKLESELMVAKMSLRGGQFAEAENRLKSLSAAVSAGAPQKPALLILLAEARLAQNNLDSAESLLRTAVGTTADPALLAQAHNALGDYFQKKDQLENAFWEYLKVDVLYNEDREEEAKALYFLSKLFEKVKNDPARARDCKDRLADKAFAGLEYARRAAAEK